MAEEATQKVLSLLGFAQRAGKLSSGTGACELSLKGGKAQCVLIEAGTGENTTKHFSDMASYRHVPCAVLAGQLGRAIGYPERKIICINDPGFARAVLKELNLEGKA